jgi:hypothetical protein
MLLNKMLRENHFSKCFVKLKIYKIMFARMILIFMGQFRINEY